MHHAPCGPHFAPKAAKFQPAPRLLVELLVGSCIIA